MSPKAPHLLLVDDHALFRMGLGQMLAAHWPDARLQQAVSWTGAMTQLATVHPADAFDVMLLDVGLPDADALQALPEVQRLAPGLPVLVMSADSRPERVARARGGCPRLGIQVGAARPDRSGAAGRDAR